MTFHPHPPAHPIQAPILLHTLPPRLQAMITILLTHRELISHYESGTLVFQFRKEMTEAKLTNNLPL